jgi:hypothetical protein
LQGDWRGPELTDAWRTEIAGADVETRGAYLHGATRIDVHLAARASISQGHEFEELRAATDITALQVPRGSMRFELLARDSGAKFLLAHAFVTSGRWFASLRAAELNAGLASLARLRSASLRVVEMRTRCAGDCSEEIKAIQGLLAIPGFLE